MTSLLQRTRLLDPRVRRSDEVPASQPDRALPNSRERELAGVLKIDAEALRGVSLPSLLASCAQLFADNGQAARDDPIGTFEKSRTVHSLSFFVSHSWRTSRLFKWAALCVHFNLQRAALATLVANFFVFALNLFCLESLPSWLVLDQMHIADLTYTRGTMMGEMVGPLVFVPVLLFGHIFDQETSLFLDIACISQDDERLKASGISSLGAILDRSERMLVLCDGNYFSRLWCLFEVAAFAKRAGLQRIDLIPLHVPLRTFGWVAAMAFFYTAMSSIMLPVIGPWVLASLYSPCCAVWTVPLFETCWMALGVALFLYAEIEAQKIKEALAALKHFELAHAACYSDADRAAILSLISKWWTDSSSGETDPERLRQLGHHRFERFVRHELAPQLAGLTSRDWTLSSMASLYVITSHGWILDLLSWDGATVYHMAAYVGYAAFCFGVWLPMMFSLVKFIAGVAWRLQKRGWSYGTAYALTLFAALAGDFVIMFFMNTITFPNVLLDPEFRWPDDGLDEFARRTLKFQLVAGGYSMATGLWFCS